MKADITRDSLVSAAHRRTLHGADTATRQRVKAQVRLLHVDDNPAAPATCGTEFEAWSSAIAAPTGTVAARAEPEAAPENECSMTPGAGYRNLLNQLYCLVIHDPGDETGATYKWSRENVSIASLWLSQDGNDLTVETQGRDPHRLFRSNGWVELIDRERELREEPGTLVRLTNVRDNILTIDPATATGPSIFQRFKRCRVSGDGRARAPFRSTTRLAPTAFRRSSTVCRHALPLARIGQATIG